MIGWSVPISKCCPLSRHGSRSLWRVWNRCSSVWRLPLDFLWPLWHSLHNSGAIFCLWIFVPIQSVWLIYEQCNPMASANEWAELSAIISIQHCCPSLLRSSARAQMCFCRPPLRVHPHTHRQPSNTPSEQVPSASEWAFCRCFSAVSHANIVRRGHVGHLIWRAELREKFWSL